MPSQGRALPLHSTGAAFWPQLALAVVGCRSTAVPLPALASPLASLPRAQLEAAVEEEDYEKAAALRDVLQ